MQNADLKTVRGFGQEWTAYDQSELSGEELTRIFNAYFADFPWGDLPARAVGFDGGCGSGRWDVLLAPRVGHLHCVDASEEALEVARRKLAGVPNVTFHHASVGALPFELASMDFGVSLGVLHHVPDTAAAIRACAACLKPGAPLLLYLYYRFDNRPPWFRALWRASDVLRRGIASLPIRPKIWLTSLLAATVYWPLARLARVLEAAGLDVGAFPLSAYRSLSFYTMKTDALDRFGTRVEQRFTRDDIAAMLCNAGMVNIRFSAGPPYWLACAFRRSGQALT